MGATQKYVIIDPQTGKIDRRIFIDQDIYDVEMAKLFGRAWLMVGHESLVPQANDFFHMIANLTLDGLERLLRAHYPPNTKRAQRAKVNLVRYCDDFLITGSSQAVLEQEVKPLVQHFLRERGLHLSQAKTHITHIEHGFDFLGQHVRKYAGKLLIKPAPKNMHTFLGNSRHIVKTNKQATAGHLIAQLNPVIRGWANYHRHVVSKAIFIKVDTAIFQTLWSWATRRHPKKSGRWIAQKYFQTRHGRQWTFVGTRVGSHGQPQELTLCRAGDVPIQRQTPKGSLPGLPSEDHQTDGLAQPSRRLADSRRP